MKWISNKIWLFKKDIKELASQEKEINYDKILLYLLLYLRKEKE